MGFQGGGKTQILAVETASCKHNSSQSPIASRQRKAVTGLENSQNWFMWMSALAGNGWISIRIGGLKPAATKDWANFHESPDALLEGCDS